MAIQQPQTTYQSQSWTPLPTKTAPRRQPQARVSRVDNGVTHALGWFSIGLGLAEVAAHRAVARLIGVREQRYLFPLLGLREMAAGLGILTDRPSTWVKARFGGDLIDLALLGAALRGNQRKDRSRLAGTTALIAGITLFDYLWAQRISDGVGQKLPKDEAIRVEKSITINRSPRQCYDFWRNFENLPRFMQHLEAVQVIDEKRSHWVAKAPAGMQVEWDAELVNDVPGEVIAWRSLENANVESTGAVRFESIRGGNATIVRLKMHYRPPGGTVGALFAQLFGERPEQQIDDDFRNFKQVMETGEIATTVGQPRGGKRQSTIDRLSQSGQSQPDPDAI